MSSQDACRGCADVALAHRLVTEAAGMNHFVIGHAKDLVHDRILVRRRLKDKRRHWLAWE